MIDPEVLKIIEHFANIEIVEDSQYSKSNYKECKCFICKKPTSSNYYTVDNKKYCTTCYEKYIVDRCHHCNQILGTYYTANNKKYCTTCYEKYIVDRCIICNKPLIEGYLYNKNGKYCYDCDKKYPKCWNCNIPVKYIGFQDDDFILCKKCNKAKITKIEDLKDIYYKVKDYAKRALGINALIKKAVLLSSADLKKENTNNYTNRATGLCERKYTGLKREKNIIYVQNGMPYNMAFQILAHEYGHAWEHQNKNKQLINQPSNDIFTEGFARWVEYYTIKEFGLKEETNLLIRDAKDKNMCDPIYGIGFKKMLKLEKKLGSKQAVLEYVKNNNDF